MNNSIHNNTSPEFFINGVLDGDVAVLSRAITLTESTKPEHKQLAVKILEGVIRNTGNSFRLGITGVPGVGKSTFIESFGKEVVERGHKLAVLAIDPSSNKSKGSILGDKTRMESLASTPGVFIRPSPSSGTLGGLARATYESMLLCEAAGFDFIIIETVGVGQSEYAVSRLTDFFLLLMLAGAGDELQGIKRGIMEMADSIIITKADGTNIQKANSAKVQYESVLHLLQPPESGFAPKVQVCSSLENKGIAEAFALIEKYWQYVRMNGYLSKKRSEQEHELLHEFILEKIKERFYADVNFSSSIKELEKRLDQKGFIEFSLATSLVDQLFNSHKK